MSPRNGRPLAPTLSRSMSLSAPTIVSRKSWSLPGFSTLMLARGTRCANPPSTESHEERHEHVVGDHLVVIGVLEQVVDERFMF